MSIIDANAWRTRWETVAMPLDRFTGDRRWFDSGAVTTRNLPMSLMLQIQTAQAHTGAVVVGSVDEAEITDSMVVLRGSWLNPDAVPEVNRALALMIGRVAKVSPDLEPDLEVQVEDAQDGGRPFVFYRRAKIAGLTIVPISAFDQPGLYPVLDEYADDSATALALTGTTSWRSMPAQPREVEYNADKAFTNILNWADGNDARARSMFLWYDPNGAEGTRDRFRLPIGDVVNGRPALNFHAVYAAAALVSGAHGGLPTVSDEERGRLRRTISEIYSRLSGLFSDPNLVAPWDKRKDLPDVKATGLNAIAASAAPIAPPAAWFTDPKLPGPTPSPVISPDGRVMVHLATHDSCHRAVQLATGACFNPPSSPSGYARFMDGTVLTAEGTTVPVGRITIGGFHPSLGLTAAAAREHYDTSTNCVAIVAAGEDEHGIWLSGSLVPEATAEQVASLRRSPISGDWRRHGAEGLDLIAALAVNTAGFPAPWRGAVRHLSVDADSNCAALVASAAPGEEEETMPDEQPTPVEQAPEAPQVGSPEFTAAVQAAVAQSLADQAQRELRTERLATMVAARDFERAGRIGGLQPVAALAMDTVAARRTAQKAGKALPPLVPGGKPRYPIRNVGELSDAIHAVGRGKGSHDELRRWIMKRARELGHPEMIPSAWKPDGSVSGTSMAPHSDDANTCLACKRR